MVVKLTNRMSSVLPLLLAATALQWSGLNVVEPLPAIAQTTVNADVHLEASEDESYRVFIARAEANAAVKVQSLFDQDLLRTEVRVTVLGQRSAVIAPVLKLRVSRQEWTSYPDPEIWSIYYPEAKAFLFTEELAPPAPAESPEMMEEEPLEPLLPTESTETIESESIDSESLESESSEETVDTSESATETTNEEAVGDTESVTETSTDEDEAVTEEETSSSSSDLPSSSVPTLVR